MQKVLQLITITNLRNRNFKFVEIINNDLRDALFVLRRMFKPTELDILLKNKPVTILNKTYRLIFDEPLPLHRVRDLKTNDVFASSTSEVHHERFVSI